VDDALFFKEVPFVSAVYSVLSSARQKLAAFIF